MMVGCGERGERGETERCGWAIRIVKRISQTCFDEMSGQKSCATRDWEREGQNKNYRKHKQRRE